MKSKGLEETMFRAIQRVALKFWNFDFSAGSMIVLLLVIALVAAAFDIRDIVHRVPVNPNKHIPFLIPGAMVMWAVIVYAFDQWFKRATKSDLKRLRDFLEGPLF